MAKPTGRAFIVRPFGRKPNSKGDGFRLRHGRSGTHHHRTRPVRAERRQRREQARSLHLRRVADIALSVPVDVAELGIEERAEGRQRWEHACALGLRCVADVDHAVPVGVATQAGTADAEELRIKGVFERTQKAYLPYKVQYWPNWLYGRTLGEFSVSIL